MRIFRLGSASASAAIVVLMVLASSFSFAASYQLTVLTADQPGIAPNTDPNLINAWGISFSPTGPFWVSDNNSGKSTLYDGTGKPQTLIVTIPSASGTGSGVPTGTVYNATGGFVVTQGGKSGAASFLFDTEDGTISGWAPTVNATVAIVAVNNSANGDDYKALELAKNGSANFLYVADFFNAKVRVFDSTFTQITPAGTFTDPNLPSGYAPYNIRNVNGQLYITYAKQNATKTDAVPGRGFGFVDIYDLDGNFIKRFASMGRLNAPWGLALAPSTFGKFANDILVGNLGDGHITAFDPTTGRPKGQLSDANNHPLVIKGLWGLMFGNGGQGGTRGVLYFSAGPQAYAHGRFGSITAQ
jgi:uncharacterized protein (TIGR03118 family)